MAKRGPKPKKKTEKAKIEVKTEEIQENEVENKPETTTEPTPEPLIDDSKNVQKKEKKVDNRPIEKTFTYEEAARRLGINENAVRLWVDHGHLVSVKVGGVRMITNSSILECPFRRFR